MKRLVLSTISVLVLLVLMPACFTFQNAPVAITPPTGVPPAIIVFSNNPTTIAAGSPSTLLWNVTGATSVSIDQGIGQVDVAGSRAVSPSKSTVYTLSATNANGAIIRTSATIIVLAPVPPQTTASNPVIVFTATHRGGASWQLNWNVTNATQIVIQPDIGPVNPIGSAMVTVPSGQTKLYRLEAVNDWGWSYWQVVMGSP